MSLLLALTAATAQPTGGPGRRVQKRRRVLTWRPYVQQLPEEPEEPEKLEVETAETVGPNELLLSFYREQQAKLAAQLQVLRIQEENAKAQEAAAKSARTKALVQRSAERMIAMQLEAQRIAQEMEEIDVAYIVALMD